MYKKTSKGLPYRQLILRIPENMGKHLQAFVATVNIAQKTTMSEKDVAVFAIAKLLGVEYMLDEYYRMKGSRGNKVPNFIRKIVRGRTLKIEQMMAKQNDIEKLTDDK